MYGLRCIRMKRDIHIWKETYTYEKRPSTKHLPTHSREVRYMCVYKEARVYENRPMYIWEETYRYEKRPTRRHCPNHSRKVTVWYMCVWKEAYVYIKTGLYICKETYRYEKRPTTRNFLNLSVVLQEWGAARTQTADFNMKINIWIKACVYEKRPMYVWGDLYVYE